MYRSDKKTDKLHQKLDSFRLLCRQKGLKLTPQRTVIYSQLIQTDEHPTAESMCKKTKKILPSLSLDTVNRTLLTLVDIGAAFIVEGTGAPKRFDAAVENHQHIKCVKCNKIFDFCHKAFDNIKVPTEIKKKFNILRKTVYIEGICEKCR